jgi:hypothetical protein
LRRQLKANNDARSLVQSKSFYIHPAIIEAYLDESLFEAMTQAASQAAEAEKAGLTLIENGVLTTLNQKQIKP